MDLCLAASPLDAHTISVAGARRVCHCPNGMDPVHRLPVERGGRGPLRAVFVGAADWEPYERGVAWLVDEVLPQVRRRHRVHLEVVGRRPPRPVLADDVEYVGEVGSVRDYYRRAEVAVVPVFEGSGTRIKVLEAIRYGRPVVSTSLGVHGLPLRADEHYRRADSAEDFAAAMLDLGLGLRAGADRVQAMIDRAHTAVTPLRWPRITATLVELYAELLR
jgi:glycosyltransferase involved in cell wall biosynthesis